MELNTLVQILAHSNPEKVVSQFPWHFAHAEVTGLYVLLDLCTFSYVYDQTRLHYAHIVPVDSSASSSLRCIHLSSPPRSLDTPPI